jgi:predicted DNA repair protein MutK
MHISIHLLRYIQRRIWSLHIRDFLVFLAKHLCGDLGLDESKSLGAVLVDVLLVSVGVVAVAAVWVRGIAVRLDDGGVGGRAGKAWWACSELGIMLVNCMKLRFEQKTYASSLARSYVVGKTLAVVGVTHEDGGLDSRERVAGQSSAGTTAEGVVHDLTTLVYS